MPRAARMTVRSTGTCLVPHAAARVLTANSVRYFATSVPGSGIFLPVHRASRRHSGASSDYPLTPTTPSYAEASSVPKFSQSVGPGVRPPSPYFKPKGRQSLPRPESPLRKPPVLAPASARGPSFGPAALSKSQMAGPRLTSPQKGVPKGSQSAKPYSRTNSRVGGRLSSGDHTNDSTPTPAAHSRISDGSAGPSNAGPAYTSMARRQVDDAYEEIARLRKQLEDRDKQLKEQAVSLAEMEASLMELSDLMPESGPSMHGRSRSGGSYEDADNAQLRAIIREKNEKISVLTAEFDAHRADFRSTIDTLELASTETERVYEKRVEELIAEIKEFQERSDDVENVAKQLKSLEELVQELEEGLDNSKREEAEARGEAEFARGEVERTRAELRRERDRSAAALRSAEDTFRIAQARGIEQRDDEIRGLKAIIHSLSGIDIADIMPNGEPRDGFPDEATRMRATIDRLEREKLELQALIEHKVIREDQLESEIQRLQRNSIISTFSDRTARRRSSGRDRDSKGTVTSWRGSGMMRPDIKPMTTMTEDSASSTAGSAILWCEICETGGHDILTCPHIESSSSSAAGPSTTSLAAAYGARASGNNFANYIKSNGGADVGGSPTKYAGNGKSAAEPRDPILGASASSSASALRNRNQSDPDRPRPLMSLKKGPLPPPPGAAPTGPLPNPLVPSPSAVAAAAAAAAAAQAHAQIAAQNALVTAAAAAAPPPAPPALPMTPRGGGAQGLGLTMVPPPAAPSSAPAPRPMVTPPSSASSSVLDSLVAGKDGTKNPNKWCAICEHDGHDSINCSLDDDF